MSVNEQEKNKKRNFGPLWLFKKITPEKNTLNVSKRTKKKRKKETHQECLCLVECECGGP